MLPIPNPTGKPLLRFVLQAWLFLFCFEESYYFTSTEENDQGECVQSQAKFVLEILLNLSRP